MIWFPLVNNRFETPPRSYLTMVEWFEHDAWRWLPGPKCWISQTGSFSTQLWNQRNKPVMIILFYPLPWDTGNQASCVLTNRKVLINWLFSSSRSAARNGPCNRGVAEPARQHMQWEAWCLFLSFLLDKFQHPFISRCACSSFHTTTFPCDDPQAPSMMFVKCSF